MISDKVSVPVEGSSMSAYLARPEAGSGSHPAVIVLQEVFGLTPETMRVTDLLPSIGYVGLAIDYYHRTDPGLSEPYDAGGDQRAFAAAARVSKAGLRSDVAAAAAWLTAQDFVRGTTIATWGFGFGGTAALIAGQLPEIAGVVAFYPTYLGTTMPNGEATPLSDIAAINAPLLICYGTEDYYVSRHEIDALIQAVDGAGKDARVQVYPNVGHSFFRYERKEAIAENRRYSDQALSGACADSWDLTVAFLRRCFSADRNKPVAQSAR